MNRLSRIIVPMLALLALLAAVVGVPILLIVFVGSPLPSPIPSPDELGDIFAGRSPIPAEYLISILAIVMWFLWAQVAWATAVEAAAAFGGRMAKRVRVIPGVQLGVAKLVTAATLLAASFTVKPAAAGPLMPVAAELVDDRPTSASPDDIVQIQRERSRTVPYTTKPGDTWWGIAEDALGSGPRWKEIRSINLGRTMEDGTVIASGTDLLKPDWRLLLPRESTGVQGQDREVVVREGDTIWGIAEDDLEKMKGSEQSMASVADHVGDIAEMNRAELNGNPDMIYPGQRLDLPAMQPLAERPPSVDGQETPDPEPETPEADAETPATTTPPTTTAPTTAAPTTVAPTTAAPTTAAPTTAAPTTAAPTTVAPTTGAPATTAAPSTTTGEDRSGDTTGSSRQAMRAGPTPEPIGEEQPGSEVADEDLASGDEPTRSLAGARAATIGGPPRPLSIETNDLLDVDADQLQRRSSATGQFRQAPTADATQGADPATQDSGSDRSTEPAARTDADDALPASNMDIDLRTGGQLTESDLVLDEAPGELEDLDTEGSRAPVFVGIAALTLIGASLYRARGRRRDTALRHRHPGRRPSPPKRKTRNVARRLAAAAEPEHGEFVNIGLRALGRQLQGVSRSRLPKISGVWVSHNRLVIALADDSPKSAPPEPFTEFADGSGWSLRRSDFGRARRVAKGANGPLPLLTTIGTTSALDLALTTNSRAPAEAYGLSSSLLFALDLEAGRVISVLANDESSTIEALTMMALELATSETADQAEIVCVGFGHRLATFDRVIVVDEISEILGDVEAITGRAEYAAGDASPFATRVGNGAADTWNPVVVFHADPLDRDADTLVELAGRTDGGVTAVCGYQTTIGWTLRVDGERISCPDLPGDLSHHSFKRPELDGVELIPDLLDEPWDDLELDDDFWSPMDPVEADHTWHLFDSDESSWRPMRSVTDPERSNQRDDAPAQHSGIAVVVSQDDVAGRRHPDDLWDSISTVDPDSWPETEVPGLKPLRHSTEHRPPADPAEGGPEETAQDEDRSADPVGRAPAGEPANDASLERPSEDRSTSDAPPPHRADSDGDAADDAFDRETFGFGPPPDGPALGEGDGRSRHLYVVDSGSAEDDHSSDDDFGDGDSGDEGSADDGSADEANAEDAAKVEPGHDDEASDELVEYEEAGDADAELASPDEAASSETMSDPAAGAAAAADSDIRISVLGNFTIESHHVGDRAKPWKYTKTPELVLYLLLHPAGASQDLLMEQLFPEQPPNRPRLNQLVSDARTKALGKNGSDEYHLPHASPTEPFYKLLPSVSLDLRDFAQHCANARAAESLQDQKREWEAALNLVKGRPFTLPHDGYEWAIPEIEATIIKVEEAAVALTDIAFELGDYRLAVWATKKGLLTETGYYELLVKRGRAALLLQDPEEIVRAFADLQVSLEYSGAPEEGMPDLSSHPDLERVYNELSSEGRTKDRPPT